MYVAFYSCEIHVAISPLSQPLQEVWSMLQDSTVCKDNDRTELGLFLAEIGVADASLLEYIEPDEVTRIAGTGKRFIVWYPYLRRNDGRVSILLI